MKHILSRANVEILAQFAWSRMLLAFDFDGTLAPIVHDRDEAGMRSATRKALALACERFPTAVISGRSLSDVEQRLCGIPVKHVVGNHGLEPTVDMERFASIVRRMRPVLEATLREHQGVEIEDKEYSVAIHYRKSRAKRNARAAIHRAIASLPDMPRVMPGKLVVNLLPEGAPHKGIALEEIRAREGADTAIFVGDDVTDEDVFELDRPGKLLGIRVGQSRSSAALFYIRNQLEMDTLLERLVGCRTAGENRWA
jgi:trehalose 6-phosphate phosphatase